MAVFTHIRTLTAYFAAYGADILGLSVSGGRLWALAGYDDTARLIEVDASSLTPLTQTLLDAGELALHTEKIDALLWAHARQGGHGYVLYADNSGQAADRVVLADVSSVSVATIAGQNGISTFSATATPTLLDQDAGNGLGAIYDIAAFQAYGQDWVVGSDTGQDRLAIWSIGTGGHLTFTGTIGATEGLGINAPSAVKWFDLGGQPYVAVTAVASNSLSILRVEPDGTVTPTDHILDDLNTRFQGAGQLVVHQVNGATFLAVAGQDDGVSIFRVLPDGRLSFVDTLVDQGHTVLSNPAALALWDDGTTLSLAVASATEAGLSFFGWDITGLGQEIGGTGAADLITGSTGGDVILAGPGDDTVRGAGGADIVVDGSGADRLTGGNGSDVFILEFDGDFDRIDDFERMRDRIDLTRYPLVHDVSAITLQSKSWGAQLTVRGDVLSIYSDDGQPLDIADLGEMFPLDRPPLILSLGGSGAGGPQIVQGNDQNNTLYGAATDDILTGNGGDDILVGGAGADQLYGGPGFDTGSYRSALSGLVVDLGDPAKNTGDAVGDIYASIEVIEGSGFADTIRGTGADDVLDGSSGNDFLDGRAADDSLMGGGGADTLRGGLGADQLDGGPGADWADYSAASNAVRVDLAFTVRAFGEAAGDRFTSIENLAGSAGDDWLYGDAQDNQIAGNAGDDWLAGRWGDDTLSGGKGDDVLMGGEGNDLLDGGTGRDRADYSDQVDPVSIALATGVQGGGAAGDTLTSIEDVAGTAENDTLTGDAAANRLFGQSGDDILSGAGGNDTLIGGDGADVFIFAKGSGTDTVADFDPETDMIHLAKKLSGTGIKAEEIATEFGQILNGTVVLDFGNGDQIILEHIDDLGALSDSFVFI